MSLTEEGKCSTCEYGRTEQCTFPLVCYGGRSWKSRSESLKIGVRKMEYIDYDLDKTCDSCKYISLGDCFPEVGACSDYDKWESAEEAEEVGEDLLTIIRGTLTKEEFQGYCLGKYLEATYYEG